MQKITKLLYIVLKLSIKEKEASLKRSEITKNDDTRDEQFLSLKITTEGGGLLNRM